MFILPRRKDRATELKEAEALLQNCEYGFLALGDDADGFGYGIPINYVKDGNAVYMHCAPDGKKLELIGGGKKASFCVVGRTQPMPEFFTTQYESAIAFGTVKKCETEEERLRGIRLLVEKYSPQFKEKAEKYIKASMPRTVILKLEIAHISGKAKKLA